MSNREAVSALGVCAFLTVVAGIAMADTYLPGEGNFDVSVWQTTGNKPFREIRTSPFIVHAYTNREPIDVDAAVPCGRYSWLGVSMTDASCYLLSQMTAEKRRALLEAVFSPERGAALRGVRLNIGSSDYATAVYNYDEVAGDVEMKHFSVARDDHWVFPMVKEALAVNPDLFFFAAPWSPPGWMKTTGNFIDGHFKDGCEEAYANYLTAYVKACAARGIDVKAVTAQNEALCTTRGTYPCCIFSAEQEAAVAHILAEKLRKEHAGTVVWLWDFVYHLGEKRLRQQLADLGLKDVIGGIAWHSYGDGEEKMGALKRDYPAIPFYHTEMGPSLLGKERTEQWWCGKMRRAFEHGCESFACWNLCLDDDGQPLVGPHTCMGLVTVNLETGDYTPSALYRIFRHVGPFVKTGAQVLKAEGDRDGLETMLFRNPDGEYVLVAVCQSGRGKKRAGADGREPRPKLYVKCAGEYKQLPLPLDTWSVTTMVFKKRSNGR